MARKNPMTAARKAFAQYVASGMTHIAAYRLAYPRSQGRPMTQHASAHEVAHTPCVADEIARLRQSAAETVGWSRDLWISEMTDEVRAAAKGSKHRLESLVELGKALGYYEAVSVTVADKRSMVIVMDAEGMQQALEEKNGAKTVEGEALELPEEKNPAQDARQCVLTEGGATTMRGESAV